MFFVKKFKYRYSDINAHTCNIDIGSSLAETTAQTWTQALSSGVNAHSTISQKMLTNYRYFCFDK